MAKSYYQRFNEYVKKKKVLFEEYDRNQEHLNELRRLNQWNPTQERLTEHGMYLVWSQSLRLQIFQLHFAFIQAQAHQGA